MIPVGDTLCRRLINEIVLGEESDQFDGRVLSHFEMYLAAMDQAGADRAPLERFLDALAATGDVPGRWPWRACPRRPTSSCARPGG